MILASSMDRISYMGEGQYQIAGHAYHMMGKGPHYPEFNHLWGQKITAVALMPLLATGLSATMSMKILALSISFLGFAALVYLLAYKAGPTHAGILALLMLFPDLSYLKWNFVLWGAYPEAANFCAAAALLWVLAIDDGRKIPLFAAGAAAGLVFSYNASAVFFIAALPLATLALGGLKTRAKTALTLSCGVLVGLLPLLIWMVLKGFRATYSPAEMLPAVTLNHWISWPDFHRVPGIFDKLKHQGFYDYTWQIAVIIPALAWAAISALREPENIGRWKLLFPMSLLSLAFFVALFPFNAHLCPRHFLWLFLLGYFCVALMLGDLATFLVSRRPRKITQWIGLAAVMIFLGTLIVSHATLVTHLIRPSALGMFLKFRGDDYYKMRLPSVVGAEVDRVNCLLDADPPFINDESFRSGLGAVFPKSDLRNMLSASPRGDIDIAAVSLGASGAEYARQFYFGVGCAVALRDVFTAGDIDNLSESDFTQARARAREGFTWCVNLAYVH